MKTRVCFVVTGFLGLFATFSPLLAACSEFQFTKIVDSLDVVPGGNGGLFEPADLSYPAVSGRTVYFRGEGGGVVGLFSGRGESVRTIVAEGDSLPNAQTVDELYSDFAVGNGVVNFIALSTSGKRGIYVSSGDDYDKVVEFDDPAPEGSTFSTIFAVAHDAGDLAFQANVRFSNGFSGVFSSVDGTIATVANLDTEIPGSEPTMFGGGSFSDPDISNGNVVFKAGYGALLGIYARVDGTLTKIVDDTDTQPGSTELFATFSDPVISGERIAFRAVGAFGALYTGWTDGLELVARAGDAAPGGSTFSGFGPNVAIDGDGLAFSASGSGFSGLFIQRGSELCRVIDTGTLLDGKAISQLQLGRDGLDGDRMAFRVHFQDGSTALYLAAPPSVPYLQLIYYLLLGDGKP